MMQHRAMTGQKLDYRPVSEAELSIDERRRLYRTQQKARRLARMKEGNLLAASMNVMANHPSEGRCYCLKVETGREMVVENSLREANVDAFMPKQKWVAIRRGEKIELQRPYFPGYVMVRCAPIAEAFHGLKKQRHVIDIVGGNEGYYAIPERHAVVLKALCANPEVPRKAVDKSWREGDRGLVEIGPFAGFQCLVTAVKWAREARASIAIDLHGRIFDVDSIPLVFLKKL